MSAHVDKVIDRSAKVKAAIVKSTKRPRRFRNEEHGSILIMSLFFLILMLMIAGMSVDLMRSETQRARLQSTLDRAILAGASLEQTLDSEAVVRDYFAKADLEQYLTSVTVVEGQNSKSVSATAETAVDTFFMNMLGIDSLRAPASGQAEESLSNIEISLILDVSGSMTRYSYAGGDSKINLLKAAASQFVYLMQCNPDSDAAPGSCSVEPNTVSISVIPYSEQVMVGETLLQEFNITNEHSESSCVDFATGDFSKPEISLTDTLYRAATIDPRTNYRSNNGTDNTSRKYAVDSRRTCRTTYGNRNIIPLSNSYSDLRTEINNLRAGGNTSIELGMKWGSALLSPDFRPAVANLSTGGSPMIDPAFVDRPYDYRARSMQKVIVLMTDGQNTTQHFVRDAYRSGMSPFYKDPDTGYISAYRESTDKYRWARYSSSSSNAWNSKPDGGSNDNAVQLSYPEFWEQYNVDYYEEAFGSWLPDPTTYYNTSSKNTRLDAICATAKAQDIEVFTIGFETTSASNLIMQNCASTINHHFDVLGTELDDAFISIAREIHELRLTL